MNTSPDQQSFTPALGFAWLTPWYDLAIRTLTRERRWRSQLVCEMNPNEGDRILDVGCGTGQLGLAILQRAPGVRFVGIDPDPQVLDIARRRFAHADVAAEFVRGFVNDSSLAGHPPFTKVVCSLVLHQVAVAEKRRILGTMYKLLQPSGELFIADYAEQPTMLMRTLFRLTVQRLDGRTNTQPNVRGILRQLMEEVGFARIRRVHQVNTATGTISIYRAMKAAGDFPSN